MRGPLGKDLAAALLGAAFALPAPAPAGQVTVKGDPTLELSGYSQTRFEYRDEADPRIVNSSFFVKRSRVKLKAQISERTSSELQVDFASSRIVKDAFVGIRLGERLWLQAGQFKKPFSREELLSSTATPAIDRGLTHELTSARLGFSGRDQGLLAAATARGELLAVRLGIFSGAGESQVARGDGLGGPQDGSSNRGKDFAARLVLKPQSESPLELAVNASARTVGASLVEGPVRRRAETFFAYGGDLKWLPVAGLTLYLEALAGDQFGDFADTLAGYRPPTFAGAHLAAVYHVRLPRWEAVTALAVEGRIERFDPDTGSGLDQSTLISGGLSLFFDDAVRWRNHVVIREFEDPAVGSTTRLVSELQGIF